MKNKGIFLPFLCFFLFMAEAFAQAGFSFESSVFIPEKTGYFSDSVYSKRSAAFYRGDFIFGNAALCVVPEFYCDYSEYPKLIFQYFDLSVFMDEFSFRLNKGRFGSGVGNIYAAETPYSIEKNVSYWNLNLSFLAGGFTFAVQEILDSKNPDKYKLPKWENSVLKVKFDSEKLESSVMGSFFYGWAENTFVFNPSLFANYILNENFNFYADAGFRLDGAFEWNFLSGAKWTVMAGDFVPSVAVEYANISEENICGIFVNLNYSDFINLYLGAKKNFDDGSLLGILSELKFSFKEFAFSVLFDWEDVSSREKFMSIGVSLNEK